MLNLNTDLIYAGLLVVSLLTCLVYNYFLYRHPQYNSRKGFTYFLVFMAKYTLLNSVVHLIAVGAFTVIRINAGVFQYDMKFYTLIQFGILLVLINGFLLSKIKQISRGNWSGYRQIVIACVLQSAIVIPLIPFNPISLLPFITSTLLVLRLRYARRGRGVKESLSVLPKRESTASYA